jgi:hypothetical protein
VTRSGEDPVGDSIALVVLHVQRLRVDELGWTPGGNDVNCMKINTFILRLANEEG